MSIIGLGVGIPFCNQKSKLLVYDSFNRANNANLNNADTGQTWSLLAGGVEISGNKAAATNTGVNRVAIQAGVINFITSAVFNVVNFTNDTITSFTRCLNASNFIGLRADKTNITLFTFINSTITVIGSYPLILPLGNSKLALKTVDNTFTILLNDSVLFEITNDNVLKTSTMCGFTLYSTGIPVNKIDDFKVEAI